MPTSRRSTLKLPRLGKRWPRPFFDGCYVTWDDLAHDPARAVLGPHSHDGRLQVDRTSPPDPVTWHTLARYGVACRGPAPADVEIWTDGERLAAWTLDNLDSYWRRLLDRAARLRSAWGAGAPTPYVTVWVVTGVTRLHYTLATGDITSKDGAGGYALRRFAERWHRVGGRRCGSAERTRPGPVSAVLSRPRSPRACGCAVGIRGGHCTGRRWHVDVLCSPSAPWSSPTLIAWAATAIGWRADVQRRRGRRPAAPLPGPRPRRRARSPPLR